VREAQGCESWSKAMRTEISVKAYTARRAERDKALQENGKLVHDLGRLEDMVSEYMRWSEALIENSFPNEGDKIFALEQWSAVRANLIGYGINW
jgi:galactokinase